MPESLPVEQLFILPCVKTAAHLACTSFHGARELEKIRYPVLMDMKMAWDKFFRKTRMLLACTSGCFLDTEKRKCLICVSDEDCS